jgi:DNA-binding transcriptional MerR regulator
MYDIQRLVAESGIPRRTIHFYVQQGLLPPPQGAGLAATYGEEHRLRLALIPILRRQGQRLDQIRARFGGMSIEEMRQMAAAEPPRVRAELLVRDRLEDLAATENTGVALRGQQRYIHYPMIHGITLVVPENLSAMEQRQVEQLLQAAQRILSPSFPIYSTHEAGGEGQPSI